MFLYFCQSFPGRVLGRHCGNSIPAAIDTSDSFAYVKFVSDASVSAPGFSLSFQASVDGTVGPQVTLTNSSYSKIQRDVFTVSI